MNEIVSGKMILPFSTIRESRGKSRYIGWNMADVSALPWKDCDEIVQEQRKSTEEAVKALKKQCRNRERALKRQCRNRRSALHVQEGSSDRTGALELQKHMMQNESSRLSRTGTWQQQAV